MKRKKYIKPQSTNFYINTKTIFLAGSNPPKEDEIIEGPENDELESKRSLIWEDDKDLFLWDRN